MSQPVQRRYKALDGLRGIAALLVVFYHAPWLTHFSNARMVNNAYVSVDFFFILSGFVIAANYAHRIVDLKSAGVFITTRLFRLYPLHFAILMVLLILEAVKFAAQGVVGSAVPPFTGPNSVRSLIENLLMAQGLGLQDRLGWNPPSWSVSAEFATYFVFAVATLAGLLQRRAVVIGLAAAAFVGYFAIAVSQGTLDVTYALGLLRCVAGFSLGVAVYCFSDRVDQAGPLRPGLQQAARAATAIAILTAVVLAVAEGAAIFLVIPLFVALIATLQFDRGVVAQALSSRAAQYLGRVSYSIYLLHMPILLVSTIILKRALGVAFISEGHRQTLEIASPWLGDLLFAGVLIAVLGLAHLTYAFVEEPGRRLGRRITDSFILLGARKASRVEVLR